jgi:ABC-2 type transport system ATP-binding protein
LRADRGRRLREAWMSIVADSVEQRLGGRTILHGVDLHIERGVFGLLGPNGAGKTTLIRILATVTRPSAGSISILGQSLGDRGSLRTIRRSIGYLPQSFSFYRRFTALDTVEYVGWLKEVPPGELRARALKALEQVGLADRATAQMQRLSGGMVRRVGIAQALVNDPDVLLLDEPTTGLDPAQRIEFRNLVRRLAERSTVLLSTHLVEDVAAVCDRVAVLDDGVIRFTGTSAELEARAGPGSVGDSRLERGFIAVVSRP